MSLNDDNRTRNGSGCECQTETRRVATPEYSFRSAECHVMGHVRHDDDRRDGFRDRAGHVFLFAHSQFGLAAWNVSAVSDVRNGQYNYSSFKSLTESLGLQ